MSSSGTTGGGAARGGAGRGRSRLVGVGERPGGDGERDRGGVWEVAAAAGLELSPPCLGVGLVALAERRQRAHGGGEPLLVDLRAVLEAGGSGIAVFVVVAHADEAADRAVHGPGR